MSELGFKSIFPTFFLSGFECSTFVWRSQGRRTLLASTQHDRCMQEDYSLLRSLEIGVSREGILWPMVDRAGTMISLHSIRLLKPWNDETFEQVFLAWDILCGQKHPELGGAPEVLDIVGCSNYSFSQMEYGNDGNHQALAVGEDRIIPVYDLIVRVWERYRRPMMIGETSGMGEGRDDWLRDLAEEYLAAVKAGVELHGICLFPAVDMPNWHDGEWLRNGFFDLVEADGDLRRVPYKPYIEELRRWQRELRRIPLDAAQNPFHNPVSLEDVIEASQRLDPKPDPDWY